MRGADQANTHRAAGFNKWELAFPYPTEEPEVDIQRVAARKAANEMLAQCFNANASFTVETGGPVLKASLRRIYKERLTREHWADVACRSVNGVAFGHGRYTRNRAARTS